MRIPLPERFTATQVIVFATLGLVAQFAEGSDPAFALLYFLFILISAISFNIAGGIYLPSGAWIFFNAMLTCIVGLTYKLFLFTPAQSNLKSPVKTMAIYCVGMAGTGVAAYLSRLLRPKKPLLPAMDGNQLRWSAIGCALFGITATVLVGNTYLEGGSVASAFQQVNRFCQMAIILGTIYEVRRSNGQRSTNLSVWASGIFLFVLGGLINFSKEGFFQPIITWIVPAAAVGYNFSRKTLLLMAGGGFFIFYFLVPYSQYARQSRQEQGANLVQVQAALGYLTSLGETRRLYQDEAGKEDSHYLDYPHLYSSTQGIMDRLGMIAYDDSLIDLTDQGALVGILPTLEALENAVPRFLWKNKPAFGGNGYAHELGVLGDEDDTTGISFSPISDAYHQVGWLGVLLLQPIVLFALFFATDSICGDVRKSPFGLLFIALFAHTAPEGFLGGQIYLLTYGVEGVVLVALLARYVMPLLATFLLGQQKDRVQRLQQFQLPASLPARTNL